MNTGFNRIGILLISGVLLSCPCDKSFAWGNLSGKIAEGNKLYGDGEYDRALTKYNDAQIEAPASPEIYFNMGNVFFRQGKYGEAVDLYQKSMEKGDIGVEAKAMYNIGNSLFQQGRLQEALEYYKQALERNPDDVDTKYNIEYTERLLKEMLLKARETTRKARQEREERQTQQQQAGEDNPFDSAQDNPFDSAQDKPSDSAQDKQARVSSTREDEDKGEGQKEGGPARDLKAGTDKEKDGKAGVTEQSYKDREDLSKDEAERFLSAFERDQKGNPLMNQQKSRGGRGYYVEKDW